MTFFQARSEGPWGKLSSVRHVIEADSIVTGEYKDGFPLFLATKSLCGRPVRATGIPAYGHQRDQCRTCGWKAGFWR